MRRTTKHHPGVHDTRRDPGHNARSTSIFNSRVYTHARRNHSTRGEVIPPIDFWSTAQDIDMPGNSLGRRGAKECKTVDK